MQTLGPNQQKLVNSLKSGKYKQTTWKMKQGDCFCFFGVVCDLLPNSSWKKLDITGLPTPPEYVVFSDDKERNNIERAMDHFGFKTGEILFALIYKNDQGKYTFNQLAQELEANPADYFSQSV